MMLLSVVTFVTGFIGDDLSTYEYVVVEHKLREGNVFFASRFGWPLWTWFLLDFIALLLVLLVSLGTERFVKTFSGGDPRVLRVAERSWIIVFSAGLVRVSAFLHNVVLYYTGFSPLLPILKAL